MASVKAFIRVSSSKKKIEKEVAVRFRVSDGRKIQLFYKSDILVDPAVWDAKRFNKFYTNPFCHRKRLFFTQNQDWYYEEQK